MSRVKCVLTVDCPTVSTIYAVETVSKKVGTYRGKNQEKTSCWRPEENKGKGRKLEDWKYAFCMLIILHSGEF